ncbi:MAG: exodeoxyribonuclease VII small subunit [Oleispira antarctica]|uniref:Exodeoxyribonuclease 7 small subunit n=1 Tax=Oleispira antarctica RB-8 TaxID=698738 RepID=R4YV90_OLEAN|nr:exodeoxyribonuclease VII small subunit [Oleispira antarctica]MBQ0793205.1 exodeoxyribonuclease VII small subunit [Oleispira antarctica]CCK77784.1 Exodeoxyribonuclease VII, small subunit, probable [Oleispira antarctica RB-8]|tara:strand:+ start:812 stop:1057 length:246 start_codon:yes stop_codon:yes gene_type:complete
MAKTTFHFEQSLAELESLVERMESGEMSLEDSLKAFEQGIKYTRDCQNALAKAEQKVQLLLQKNGQMEAQPFNTPSIEDED